MVGKQHHIYQENRGDKKPFNTFRSRIHLGCGRVRGIRVLALKNALAVQPIRELACYEISKGNFLQNSSVNFSIVNANRRRVPRVKAISRSEGQFERSPRLPCTGKPPRKLEEQGVSYCERVSTT